MAERGDGWDDKEIGRPCVLRVGDAWWMWYAGSDSRFERAIGLAHSADGMVWQRFGPGPVLAPPGRRFGPGYHSLANPAVVRRGDGFLLVANAQGGRAGQDLVASESADGVTWSASWLLAASEGGAGYGAPWLVARSDILHLFAAGQTGGPESAATIRHAIFDEGRTWSWRPACRLDGDGEMDHPCVIAEDDRFVLWVGRYRGGRWEIHRAEGIDGDAWGQSRAVVLPGPDGALDSAGAMAPCVVRDGPSYVMWFLGSSRSSDGYRGVVLRAWSADGVGWRREPADPVFRPSPGLYLNPF